MNQKNVYIIGAGLYGCLTALKLKKRFPACNISLIDSSDHVLSAFDPIKLDGNEYNNGFHGIELPRASLLCNFIETELNVKLKKVLNKRKLFLSGSLVEYTDSLDQFPEEVKKHYLGVPDSVLTDTSCFFKYISNEYMHCMTEVSKRYSDNFDNAVHLLAPWYFPADFVLESNDEGDVFRNSVRSGRVSPMYAYPESSLFYELEAPFHKSLLNAGVNLILGTKIEICDYGIEYHSNNEKTKIGNQPDDVVFLCTSPIAIVKKYSPKLFEELTSDPRVILNAIVKIKNNHNALEYTEILCADPGFPELSRISKPKTMDVDNYSIVQLEIFAKPDWEQNADKIVNSSCTLLGKIYTKCTDAEIQFMDIKPTRRVFFPGNETAKLAFDVVDSWCKRHSITNFPRSFGPINMAKTWVYSDENVNLFGNIMEHSK